MKQVALSSVILRILDAASPYPVPQATLLSEANRAVRPPVQDSDWKLFLSIMLDRGFIDFLPDPLEPDNADERRWLIKEAGQAYLRR